MASATRKSARTTATMRSPAFVDSSLWLAPGQIVHDAIGGAEFRIVRFLGQGGFGAAYQAARRPVPKSAAETCVLKVTIHAPTWHREAYFGHLLRHLPGLVEVYGSFAWLPPGNAVPLYCLVEEFVDGGDLAAHIQRHAKPWPETRARREIVRLLGAITAIHQSGAVHRDITPRNIFVAAGRALKLGDFGIASHRPGRKDVAADAFAPHFAPGAIQQGARRWRQADDVYQIGQIYGALLSGIATRKLTAAEVKRLPCSAHAKTVLQRCIGKRTRCFASAIEMLEAMRAPEAETRKPFRGRSLRGKRLVFTGSLSILRGRAAHLARKAGATVEKKVGSLTDIVVIGDQSPHWKAEAKGQKLLDVDYEAERGHEIAILRESRFLALVRAKASRR